MSMDVVAEIARFVAGMRRPSAYPHPVEAVELLETHISWVFLAGDYAYKVKKPVSLAFLDFSTLPARKRFCEEELRVNRRFAPSLYLDVVKITGARAAPRVNGSGEAIEYAVRMRRFPQETLGSALLAQGRLTPVLLQDFGAALAEFHAHLPGGIAPSDCGQPSRIIRHARANFDELDVMVSDAPRRAVLAQMRAWTERQFTDCAQAMGERHARGMTRECHGDLHLRNIVLIGGRLVPFDGIEFDDGMRWIDVIDDAAFLAMDLRDRGAEALAWMFLNAYLEASGDYAAVGVLRFYLVYRAMVRAKVHAIRARQPGLDQAERSRLLGQLDGYLALARRCAGERRRAVVLMHGFSGCGKSVLAGELAAALGGFRIRSDVERKRLHGLSPLAATGSATMQGLYESNVSRATYAALGDATVAVVAAGYCAIVDATFLLREQRRTIAERAREAGATVIVLDVRAPLPVLRERLQSRVGDASEATLAVLEHQLASAEPLLPDEDLLGLECENSHDLRVVVSELAPRVDAAMKRTRSG